MAFQEISNLSVMGVGGERTREEWRRWMRKPFSEKTVAEGGGREEGGREEEGGGGGGEKKGVGGEEEGLETKG